jgi:hypothetical protein
MGDETWVDHLEEKFKQQLMDLHHTTPRKKTFKSKLAEGKPRLQSLGIKKGVFLSTSCLQGQPFYHSLGFPCSPVTGDGLK